MTQHQFKVGQKVKVVRGFNEDPEAVDGNRNILAGHINEVVDVQHNPQTDIQTWIQIKYIGSNGTEGHWYVLPRCLAPVRKKVYV